MALAAASLSIDLDPLSSHQFRRVVVETKTPLIKSVLLTEMRTETEEKNDADRDEET
jgi:hypothetical protein